MKLKKLIHRGPCSHLHHLFFLRLFEKKIQSSLIPRVLHCIIKFAQKRIVEGSVFDYQAVKWTLYSDYRIDTINHCLCLSCYC